MFIAHALCRSRGTLLNGLGFLMCLVNWGGPRNWVGGAGQWCCEGFLCPFKTTGDVNQPKGLPRSTIWVTDCTRGSRQTVLTALAGSYHRRGREGPCSSNEFVMKWVWLHSPSFFPGIRFLHKKTGRMPVMFVC